MPDINSDIQYLKGVGCPVVSALKRFKSFGSQ